MKKDDRLGTWEEREKRDQNANGIDDRLEPPPVSIGAGVRELEERFRKNPNTNPILSGGDVDARWEEAESSGDETVGGSSPTPDQGVVDDIGAAVGVTYQDDEELKVGEKEHSRDQHRWELDPASSEDYEERIREKP
jgi:hypothetical protein